MKIVDSDVENLAVSVEEVTEGLILNYQRILHIEPSLFVFVKVASRLHLHAIRSYRAGRASLPLRNLHASSSAFASYVLTTTFAFEGGFHITEHALC